MVGTELESKTLDISTLGPFTVCCGETLLSDDSISSKPWQFLAYLITHREKPAPPEVILETLWPEQQYAQAKKALHNLAYRLKQKMKAFRDPSGNPAITLSRGCYVFNGDAGIRLDVEDFESLCRQAFGLKEKDPSLAINKYREALNLYRGDYLSEWPAVDWIIPSRQYYRRLLMRSVTELLGLLKQAGRYSEITTLCEEVFRIDPLEEDLHLSYMEALLEKGKTAKARTHYQYITSALYQEIGVNPSEAMRRLYRTMKTEGGRSRQGFSDIQGLIRQREKATGALFCKPHEFEFLCKLERRRAARGDYPVHVGLLTLAVPEILPPSEEREALLEGLKKALLCCLRKGDVVSRLNETQFVVLLAGQDHEKSEKVLSRLRKKYLQGCQDQNVILRRSVHSLLPWETS